MIRRLRMILPPAPVLISLAVFYLVFETPILVLERLAGLRIFMEYRPGVVFPLVTALAYGVYRVAAFHPFYRPNYRTWLERSPWTCRKPLPLGPISLVWEDGVVLSLLALLCLVETDLDPVRLLTLFLIGYLGTLGLMFHPAGAWGHAYAMAFGLGLVVRLTPVPLLALAVAIVLVAIGRLGLNRSLEQFPWSTDWKSLVQQTLTTEMSSNGTGKSLGWPFDQLGLKWSKSEGMGGGDAFLIGPLAGWWLFALEALCTDPVDQAKFVGLSTPLILLSVSAFRLLYYVPGYHSPISLVGRLVSFRWIIPGYDVVFVAPLCTVAFPLALYGMLRTMGLAMDFSCAISLALGLLVALNMGPSLKRWQLTGRHRIAPIRSQDMVQPG